MNGGELLGSAYMVDAGTVGTVLGGTAALVKSTAGTVLLNGANTYTGVSIINAGTLLLGAAERLNDAGALTLNGGRFDLGNYSERVALVTLVGVRLQGER